MASSNVDPAVGRKLGLVVARKAEPSRGALRRSRALPVGTERRRIPGQVDGLVMVKVSDRGKRSARWRPKHHVVWERANDQQVPPGFRVVFKDGNKQNFDAANLELNTRGEIFARAMARFLSHPPALRKVIRLNRQLERELRRQMRGRPAAPAIAVAVPGKRKGVRAFRWTPQMVEVLRRDYPTQPLPELAAAIGVSVSQMRGAARRSGIRRSPEAMVAQAKAAAAIARQALREVDPGDGGRMLRVAGNQ